MSTIEDNTVHDILMCVIGDALMEADASFLFGHDFGPIIRKWAPLLRRKDQSKVICREDIIEIKQLVAAVNESTPFLGSSHSLIQSKLDILEEELCD